MDGGWKGGKWGSSITWKAFLLPFFFFLSSLALVVVLFVAEREEGRASEQEEEVEVCMINV